MTAPPEVRLDRMRPAEIAAAMARAPIAWIPLGALEYHADHLPNGTDGITGQGLLVRAARAPRRRRPAVVVRDAGHARPALVLPLRPGARRRDAAPDPRQLPAHGARLAVVHTGHAPARPDPPASSASVPRSRPRASALRAYGLCYLELNAALGHRPRHGLAGDRRPRLDDGDVVGGGARARARRHRPAARRPGRRDRRRLRPESRGSPSTPAAAAPRSMPPPRCSPSVPPGSCAARPSTRWPTCARSSSATGPSRWPCRDGRATSATAAIGLTNPGPVSRYVSGFDAPDWMATSSRPATSCSSTRRSGETGVPFRVDELGPEHGFYVRRQQTAELRLHGAVPPGTHAVELVGAARRGDGGASRRSRSTFA